VKTAVSEALSEAAEQGALAPDLVSGAGEHAQLVLAIVLSVVL
jgi:hypothetical protein